MIFGTGRTHEKTRPKRTGVQLNPVAGGRFGRHPPRGGARREGLRNAHPLGRVLLHGGDQAGGPPEGDSAVVLIRPRGISRGEVSNEEGYISCRFAHPSPNAGKPS